MRITLEADYAVRIVDCLAGSGQRLIAKTLSEQTGVSLRFALKILRKLCKAGLLRSYQGIQGGFELARRPEDITLKEVIEAIDGPVMLNRCMETHVCSRVGDPELCEYHSAFQNVSRQVRDALQEVTFDRKKENRPGRPKNEK